MFLLLYHLACLFSRNGRWRSQWSVTFPESGGMAEIVGILKVQVRGGARRQINSDLVYSTFEMSLIRSLETSKYDLSDKWNTWNNHLSEDCIWISTQVVMKCIYCFGTSEWWFLQFTCQADKRIQYKTSKPGILGITFYPACWLYFYQSVELVRSRHTDDGLVQDYDIFSALAVELTQSHALP